MWRFPLLSWQPGGSWRSLAFSWRSVAAFCSAATVASAVYLLHRARSPPALLPAKTGVPEDRPASKASSKEENDALHENLLFLAKLPAFRALARDQVPILASASISVVLPASQSVFLGEGISLSSDLSIVTAGEATVSLAVAQEKPLKVLTRGDFFGAGSLPAGGKTACVLTVGAHADLSLLVVPSNKLHEFALCEKLSIAHGEDRAVSRDAIKRNDLVKIGLLGCGGFASVELHRHMETNAAYALKGVSKGFMVKSGMQSHAFNEKHALSMTNSPFIIKLYETYSGAQSLYFLLEAALGGELYGTYKRLRLHGSLDHCRFYIASMSLAIEHLHERNMVYRSLKPENIVLDSVGYPKLIDFDLAKFIVSRTYTTCGTPDYFAPEVIASTGHGLSVDWWTLGILAFELMSGSPPFEAPSQMQTYAKIMKGIGQVVIPEACRGSTDDLIKALLQREPSARLPVRTGGIQNLRKHQCFRGFGWSELTSCALVPPHTPTVAGNTDLSNFGAPDADRPRMVAYESDGSGWDETFAGMM